MRLIGCWQGHGRFTAERHYCHRYVQSVETLLDLGMFDAVMAQFEVPRLVTVAQVAANVIVSFPTASSSGSLTPTRQLSWAATSPSRSRDPSGGGSVAAPQKPREAPEAFPVAVEPKTVLPSLYGLKLLRPPIPGRMGEAHPLGES